MVVVAAAYEKKIHTLKKAKCVLIGIRSVYVENKIRVRYDHECKPSYLISMQIPYVSLHKVANESFYFSNR